MFFAHKELFIDREAILKSSQYIVDAARHIGCELRAAIRLCGIGELVENTPVE